MKRLLLVAIGAAAAAAAPAQNFSGAKVVNVTLADYKFIPSSIQLQAGKAVILKLSNAAGQPHEFAAPEFFRSANIRASDAKSVNREGEAEIAGGKQVTIALVPKAGTYHLQCNKPGHLMLGMEGTIVVK